MALNEGLVWSGTDLNDNTNYNLRAADFTPPNKRPEWIQGADADGSALVRDPLFENRVITLNLRVNPAGTLTMDQALTKVGALVDLCEEAEKQQDGLALAWTPAQGTRSITFYVLSGEVNAIPVAKDSQVSGWFRKAPMVELKLTCKPFGYGAAVTSAATLTDTNPAQVLTLAAVTGDVPAEGRLVVTDAATQSRRHVEWGLQQRYYAAGVPRIFDQFASDSIGAGSYTFDASTSATLAVSGGLLVPSSTVEKRLHRNDTGTASYTDTENTVKVTTGASVASGSTGLYARRVDATNFLHANLNFAGAASTLTIVKRVAGADTTLATSSTFTPVAATAYWLKFTLKGTALTVAYYTADPNAGGAAASSTTATLSSGDFTTFSTGASGLRLIPQATDYRWDDFKINPLAGYTGLLLSAAPQLVSTGFAGAGTTRSGAFSLDGSGNTVVRTTMLNQPIACCGLGTLGHVGTFRVKARVYGTATTNIKLSWQDGDGPFRDNDYVATNVNGNWSEVDLGLVTITEKALGAQKWSGQIVANVPSTNTANSLNFLLGTPGTDTLDVDYVLLIPTEQYGKGRSAYSYAAGAVVARDEFTSTTAGVALNARTAPLGGAWATSGVATDFAAADAPTATDETESRTTAGDAAGGRYAILGSTNYTDTEVGVSVYTTNATTVSTPQQIGAIARWTDASNHVRAYLNVSSTPNVGGFIIAKRIAGVDGQLAAANFTPAANTWYAIRIVIYATGFGAAHLLNSVGTVLQSVAFTDSVLATGGTLATGKPGFQDINGSISAATRYYDSFYAGTPAPEPIVVYSGRSAEIRSDSTLRQDSSGVYYGRFPLYRGGRFLPPPAGSVNRPARILVKLRRNDIDVAADDQIADSTTATVHYVPRYLVIPR